MSDEERRRPGRPRLAKDDETIGVSIKMPARQYDDVFKRAQRARVSVSELIRRQLSDEDVDK